MTYEISIEQADQLQSVITQRLSWASAHWFPTRTRGGIKSPVIDANIAPQIAAAILNSDWVEGIVTRAIAAERERLAQAIEARNDSGLDLDNLPEWDDSCMGHDEAWAHGLADALGIGARGAGGDVSHPNRAPNISWSLRWPLTRYPNGYILTADDDEIRVTYFMRPGYAQTMFMRRADARLIAKRINQCLDATVKK